MKVDELRRLLAPLDGNRELVLPLDADGAVLERVLDVSFELMGRGADGQLFLVQDPLDDDDTFGEDESACVVFWPGG